MSQQRKDMTGVLFRSASQNPKAPVLSGYIVVKGEELRLSAWYATDENGQKRRDKNGHPFLNVKVQRSEDRPPRRQEYPADEDFPI